MYIASILIVIVLLVACSCHGRQVKKNHKRVKKVLDVIPYQYLPYFSGGQKSIAQFLDYLGQETELSVITVPGNDEKMAESYRLFPLLKKGATRYYDFSLIAKIVDFVKREQIQTIIWEHPYYAWLAFSVRKNWCKNNISYTQYRIQKV